MDIGQNLAAVYDKPNMRMKISVDLSKFNEPLTFSLYKMISTASNKQGKELCP